MACTSPAREREVGRDQSRVGPAKETSAFVQKQNRVEDPQNGKKRSKYRCRMSSTENESVWVAEWAAAEESVEERGERAAEAMGKASWQV